MSSREKQGKAGLEKAGLELVMLGGRTKENNIFVLMKDAREKNVYFELTEEDAFSLMHFLAEELGYEIYKEEEEEELLKEVMYEDEYEDDE